MHRTENYFSKYMGAAPQHTMQAFEVPRNMLQQLGRCKPQALFAESLCVCTQACKTQAVKKGSTAPSNISTL